MSDIVGLDFETYSGTDLIKHGLDRYISDPDFRVLIACSVMQRPDGAWEYKTFDFVNDLDAHAQLSDWLKHRLICAHNAGFEAAVLQKIGIQVSNSAFRDSAVYARAAGAASSLEAAAPQLLNTNKVETGKELIQLFSVPGKYQVANGSNAFDPQIVADHPDEWHEFIRYCKTDARLSLDLVEEISSLGIVSDEEASYTAITMEMNQIGWPVNVADVEAMNQQYLDNVACQLEQFRKATDSPDLNFDSFPQQKQWCADRGVRASSFDEKAVSKLHTQVSKRLSLLKPGDARYDDYSEVLMFLEVKQALGGSSLKKLQKILDTVGEDGRLRDQYLHCGAGQTLRTTGRAVQMQNLKRLSGELIDMDQLHTGMRFLNEDLAENIRQVFTSSHPQGELVVGDFSSVESRGLAWLAGESWKLDEYFNGRDIYKSLAAKKFAVPYEDVTKSQRQFGKVGELSCGYGAGPGAVQSFAAGMGVELSEGEASKLVLDWRNANPKVEQFWHSLDQLLALVLSTDKARVSVGPEGDAVLLASAIPAPRSLLKQTGLTQSLRLDFYPGSADNSPMMTRIFHGIHQRGGNLRYFKPSARKTGDLWVDSYTDPKTKQVRHYELYGGKLSGILTQSLCRELFFTALGTFHRWTKFHKNVQVIGQFHDEIVVDWVPGSGEAASSLPMVKKRLHDCMSSTPLDGFPLECEVKSAYRYIK